jgi:flagellar capping protein FliD
MTTAARNYFYVNEPQIIDKAPFATNCPSGTEQTVVLGCYHGNQSGIFLLKVTDPRLDGVEQVTAAHEMLHAAYDRLSSRQKQSVDNMLLDFYNNGLNDPVVKAQLDDYKKSEPHDLTNEMHSLFGSEVANLPANLEAYYQKYFTSRKAVADLYAKYQAEFTNRQNQIKAYDAQLASLKAQIDAQEKTLDSQSNSLVTQRARLDAERKSGDIQAYNSQVAGFNAQVDAYNAAANNLRALISSYNALVQTRNSVAAETNLLTSEISNQVPSVDQ